MEKNIQKRKKNDLIFNYLVSGDFDFGARAALDRRVDIDVLFDIFGKVPNDAGDDANHESFPDHQGVCEFFFSTKNEIVHSSASGDF